MNLTATYTDLYQLTMAQVYFKTKPDGRAVYDYYFRNNPFKGGYSIFAGLEDVLDILETLKFTSSDVAYLEQHGFERSFLDYLKDFRFQGNIYSSKEGDIVFPTRPILQVEANIIEAQIIETFLLNILNFQTLIATKARRIRHSFIQSYEDELQAFRDFAKFRPKNCVLLIDTYNTLKSGLPNAITVAKEMEQVGEQLWAVRLDSGDLAYLSKRTRKMLDDANLGYIKIVASNQLDEFVIKSLKEQGAPIDIFGVGTNLVTGKPDAALDGVYKLSEYNGEPRIKLSENIIKVSLPYKKQVYRMLDKNGMFYGAEAVAIFNEENVERMEHSFDSTKSLELSHFEHEPLLQKVMENGKKVLPARTVSEIAAYSKLQLEKLPEEYKRFQNPHIYKIGLSTKLKEARNNIVLKYKF